MSVNIIIRLIPIISIISVTFISTSTNKADALNGFKTIKMQKLKTYHCYKRGSGKILNGRSTFKCELMRRDSKINPYDYVSTGIIVKLYCASKMAGEIEYDEGTIYKYLISCEK